MSSHTVLEDDSALSKADRALHKVETWLTLLGGLTILAVMLLSVVNILGRKFFSLPVPGFVDWMVQAVPIIAFLGIAFCMRVGSHIRMDMVVGSLKGRVLWTFELVSVAIMFALTAILVFGSWDHAIRAFEFGDSTIDINLPTWPVKMLIPIMFVFLLARLLLQIWGYWVALRNNASKPVAVPLVANAAELAAQEAETVSGARYEGEANRFGRAK